MPHRFFLGVSAALCICLALNGIQAGESKTEPGFTPLLKGATLDGWRTKSDKKPLEGQKEAYKGRFKLDKGVLVIDPSVKGDSYIETTREFARDVHVKLDFKPGEKCNNDFFLRGTKFDVVLKGKGVKNGEWNTLEILVTGDKVEHKINGETVRTSTTKSKASPLMIRAEFGAIEIKNIRVKE